RNAGCQQQPTENRQSSSNDRDRANCEQEPMPGTRPWALESQRECHLAYGHVTVTLLTKLRPASAEPSSAAQNTAGTVRVLVRSRGLGPMAVQVQPLGRSKKLTASSSPGLVKYAKKLGSRISMTRFFRSAAGEPTGSVNEKVSTPSSACSKP